MRAGASAIKMEERPDRFLVHRLRAGREPEDRLRRRRRRRRIRLSHIGADRGQSAGQGEGPRPAQPSAGAGGVEAEVDNAARIGKPVAGLPGISPRSRTYPYSRRRHVARKAVRAAAVLLLLSGLGGALYAQRGWVYLGEANVDGNADHDRIKVGRDDGRFRALQIRVERAPIEFQRVVVHYGNGADEQLDIRQESTPAGRLASSTCAGTTGSSRASRIWYARGSWSSSKPKLRLYGRF